MAEVQINDLMVAYEQQIGSLQGQLIRTNVKHAAEMSELVQRLSIAGSALAALREHLDRKAKTPETKQLLDALAQALGQEHPQIIES